MSDSDSIDNIIIEEIEDIFNKKKKEIEEIDKNSKKHEFISGSQIKEFCQNMTLKTPQVITYSEIDNLDLNKNNGHCCFILYETSERVGHWTICFYNNYDDMIEFFDPYGLEIDDQLEYSMYPEKDQKLIKHLLNSDEKQFEINNDNFQSDGNTCGKWCLIRYLFSKAGTKEDFKRTFHKIPPELRDDAIDEIYNNLTKFY